MTDYYEPTEVSLEERGTVTVEAPSVEAALEAVARQFGEGAQIVKAEKVTKGGIGGFFGKETYQITVAENPIHSEPAPGESGGPDATSGGSGPGRSTRVGPTPPGRIDAAAVDLVLERLEADEITDHGTFGEALRAELRARDLGETPPMENPAPEVIDLRDGVSASEGPGSAPVGHMPWTRPPAESLDFQTGGGIGVDPSPTRSAPADTGRETPTDTGSGTEPGLTYSPPRHTGSGPETERPLGWPSDGWQTGTGPVDWSMDRLARMGLPYSWLSRIDGLDPLDDMAWVHRLARIATEVCGPFPTGDHLTVGLDTRGVAGVLGLPTVVFPGVPRFEGNLAVSLLSPSRTALDWLDRIRARRPIHLVIDPGLPAHVATETEPAVVSWVDGALTNALEVVTAGESVLGYRFRSDGHVVRVSPFELALSIRELLPRR